MTFAIRDEVSQAKCDVGSGSCCRVEPVLERAAEVEAHAPFGIPGLAHGRR